LVLTDERQSQKLTKISKQGVWRERRSEPYATDTKKPR